MNFTEVLRTYDPERDRDAKFRFGADGAAASGLPRPGKLDSGLCRRARAFGEEALARADKTAHAPTRGVVYYLVSRYDMVRGDPENVGRTAQIPVDLSREHEMALHLMWGEVLSNWARARSGDREGGMTGLREALAAYLGRGNKLFAPLFQGRLAELEGEGGRTRTDPCAGSTKLWRLRTRPASTGPTRSCIASAAQSCSSAIRRTLHLPKKPIGPPLPSRRTKALAATSCLPPSPSPNSINRLAAPPRPTPS